MAIDEACAFLPYDLIASCENTKVLKDLNAAGKILIIADLLADENKNLVLSARNINSVKLILPQNLNVKDLVEADTIIATESAINSITERLAK